MTKRATFTETEVKRLIKGAIQAGWAWGTFKIVAEGGRVWLEPLRGETPEPGEDWVALAGKPHALPRNTKRGGGGY